MLTLLRDVGCHWVRHGSIAVHDRFPATVVALTNWTAVGVRARLWRAIAGEGCRVERVLADDKPTRRPPREPRCIDHGRRSATRYTAIIDVCAFAATAPEPVDHARSPWVATAVNGFAHERARDVGNAELFVS